MRTYQEYINENRKPEEIKDDEIGLFISEMMNLVTSKRRTNKKAADVYHDVMMKGRDKFVKWLEINAVPIWEKYGYQELGSQGWGKFEEEFMWKFLIDLETKELKDHYKKLKRNWKRG